jgi:hypothetical protein
MAVLGADQSEHHRHVGLQRFQNFASSSFGVGMFASFQ